MSPTSLRLKVAQKAVQRAGSVTPRGSRQRTERVRCVAGHHRPRILLDMSVYPRISIYTMDTALIRTYLSLRFAQAGNHLRAIETASIRIQCENDGSGRVVRICVEMRWTICRRVRIRKRTYLLDRRLVQPIAESTCLHANDKTPAYVPGLRSSIGSTSCTS